MPIDEPSHANTAASGNSPPTLEEPLSWSVPMARLGSTVVRVHASLLATIVVVLVRAAWHAGDDGFPLGPRLAAVLLAALAMVSLLHEIATLLAYRRLGGHLPEIVIQPLGGLDDGVPPPGWRRAVVAAMIGPLVAATIALSAALVLAIATAGSAPSSGFSVTGLWSPSVAASPWLEAVYILGAVSTAIAFVNLLPAPPFRGRLLLESLLRPHLGPTRARRATQRAGIAATIVIGVAGILTLSLTTVLVAALCGLALLRAHRTERSIVEAFGNERDEIGTRLRTDAAVEQDEAEAEAALEERRRAQARAAHDRENEQLDRILEKIARDGMGSLDREEQRVLARATRRRKDSES